MVDLRPVDAVALIVVYRRDRPIDRNLGEVRPTQTRQLRIEIRKQPSLEEWIIGDVDAWHQVASVEGDLLGLGEEVFGISIQRHFTDATHWHQLFGPQLGRVEDVEWELELVLLFEDLHP